MSASDLPPGSTVAPIGSVGMRQGMNASNALGDPATLAPLCIDTLGGATNVNHLGRGAPGGAYTGGDEGRGGGGGRAGGAGAGAHPRRRYVVSSIQTPQNTRVGEILVDRLMGNSGALPQWLAAAEPMVTGVVEAGGNTVPMDGEGTDTSLTIDARIVPEWEYNRDPRSRGFELNSELLVGSNLSPPQQTLREQQRLEQQQRQRPLQQRQPQQQRTQPFIEGNPTRPTRLTGTIVPVVPALIDGGVTERMDDTERADDRDLQSLPIPIRAIYRGRPGAGAPGSNISSA